MDNHKAKRDRKRKLVIAYNQKKIVIAWEGKQCLVNIVSKPRQKKIGNEEPNRNIRTEDPQTSEWFLYFYIRNNQSKPESNREPSI